MKNIGLVASILLAFTTLVCCKSESQQLKKNQMAFEKKRMDSLNVLIELIGYEKEGYAAQGKRASSTEYHYFKISNLNNYPVEIVFSYKDYISTNKYQVSMFPAKSSFSLLELVGSKDLIDSVLLISVAKSNQSFDTTKSFTPPVTRIYNE